MHTPVRIGMVGSGFAALLHLNAYRHLRGDAQVYAICSTGDNLRQVAAEYGIEKVYTDYTRMLRDEKVDVVDIITPPNVHTPMLLEALAHGKHVICEKPLTGYCKPAADESGKPVRCADMLFAVEAELAQMEDAIRDSGRLMMYAENYVYAPAVQKCAEFLRAKQSKVLLIKGEESHSGSHAQHAPYWRLNGGGALIRQGCHPLSAAIYLKRQAARARGEEITVTAVSATASVLTRTLTEQEHRFLSARPFDVEDFASVMMTFSDGTHAQILASDVLVGGVRNTMELYTNEGCYQCNIAPSSGMLAYHETDEHLSKVYITEKLGQSAGWQPVFLEEDLMRGYVGELRDFIACVQSGKTPEADFALAKETMRAVYAAYTSAQEGRVVRMD